MGRTPPLPRCDPAAADDDSLEPLRRAIAMFAVQHGAASDLQLRRAGITIGRQQRLIRRGVWSRCSPGVVAVAGSASSWHQRAMIGTLSAGSTATLAGAAAARLHQLDGFADVRRIVVIVSDSGRIRVPAELTVIRSRRLTLDDVEVVDGIRVTTVGVTLVHLAMYRFDTRRALDSALRSGITPATLRETFARWNVRGVAGPPRLLRQLHERAESRLPRSWFQRLAKDLLQRHGLAMVDEWPVLDHRGRLLAELDLANVELMVGVECQSWAWHGSPAAQAHDARRKRLLRRMGWDIVELWWSDLGRIDEVVEDVRQAIDRARSRRAQPI